MIRHRSSHRVDAALVGLFVGALVVIFFAIATAGLVKVQQAASAPSEALTLGSIIAATGKAGALAEYDQKVPDCAGFVPGMNGYAFVKLDSLGQLRGVVIVCKP